jgi:hypothetical protein
MAFTTTAVNPRISATYLDSLQVLQHGLEMGRRRKSLNLSTRETARPRAHVNSLALSYSHHERRIQNTVPCITK